MNFIPILAIYLTLAIGGIFTIENSFGGEPIPSGWENPENSDSSSAEDGSEKYINLRLNPGSLVFGQFVADADFRIGRIFTIGPSIGIWGKTNQTVNKFSAITLGIRTNFYLDGEAMATGVYLGVLVNYVKGNFDIPGDLITDLDKNALQIAAIIGYNWIWTKGWNLHFGFGLQYVTYNNDIEPGVENPFANKGILPALEISGGYAF